MGLATYVHGDSDPGLQRTQNEDSFHAARLTNGSWLLVVCDGMGGHEAGDVASRIARDSLMKSVDVGSPGNPPEVLYNALTEAHRAVLQAARERGGGVMGTTGVVAWIFDARCYVGWVGDSRLYHFRGGHLVDRTRDHTRVEQMLRHGILTPEQAHRHPDAHVLVQALGGSHEDPKAFKPEVWNEPIELEAGDALLLCSDGLYDLIEDQEIYPLIVGLDYKAAVKKLIDTANGRGGTDNVTVILFVVGSPRLTDLQEKTKDAFMVERTTAPDGLPALVKGKAPAVVNPPVSTAPALAPPVGVRVWAYPVPLWAMSVVSLLMFGLGTGLGSLMARRAPNEGAGVSAPERNKASVEGSSGSKGEAGSVSVLPPTLATEGAALRERAGDAGTSPALAPASRPDGGVTAEGRADAGIAAAPTSDAPSPSPGTTPQPQGKDVSTRHAPQRSKGTAKSQPLQP